MAGMAAFPTFLILFTTTSAHLNEGSVLLEFKSTLSGPGTSLPSWIANAAPCLINHTTWEGVICFNGRVRGLQLEHMGFTGRLDLSPLVSLRGLRTLSFMGNDLEGPMPDIVSLGALKAVHFSKNWFSWEIHDAAFAGMHSLKKVFLSRNQFFGPIPTSLATLPKLVEVRIDYNKFVGRIPEFNQLKLEIVDVSFNRLVGEIPESLSNMDSGLFQGNDGLCGAPLNLSCDQTSQPKKVLSGGLIALIILACFAALLLILVFILAVARRRHNVTSIMSYLSLNKTDNCTADEAENLQLGILQRHGANAEAAGGKKSGKENVNNVFRQLTFVRERRERFDLDDLLRASAEELGCGILGASYKEVLSVGQTVVVKKFKEMNGVGSEDFDEHMRRLGRLSHPNILQLLAYNYKKRVKLLVFDFVANGSLAHMLHGNLRSTLPPLDWPTRLKIVKGVACGLAYLYNELPVLSLPHGHLKSSNVLLNETFEPLLTDYALVPVINAIAASQFMVAYKSPKANEFGQQSKKSDVWSFGNLILEILTGKFPGNFLHKDQVGGTDLAAWVSSVLLEEEWSSEVFDGDLKGSVDEGNEEINKLLKIELDCCEEDTKKRPEMREVVERIKQLREW